MAVELDQLDYAAIGRREEKRNRGNRGVFLLMIALSILWLAPFYYAHFYEVVRQAYVPIT